MPEAIERRAAKRRRRKYSCGAAVFAVLLIAIGTASDRLSRLRAREVAGRSIPDRPAVRPAAARSFARSGPASAELVSGRLPRRPGIGPTGDDLRVTFSPDPDAAMEGASFDMAGGRLPAVDGRSFWRYAGQAGGHFRLRSDWRWEEVGRDGKTFVSVWEEISRTPDYVELYDPHA